MYLILLSHPPPHPDSLRIELSSRMVFDFKTDSVVYIAFTATGTKASFQNQSITTENFIKASYFF